MSPSGGRKTIAAFSGAVLIGGANYIAVSFSNKELPPFLGAATRFAAAAVLFFVLALVMRVRPPRGRALTGAVSYGLLGFGVAYAFAYYALVGLSAGITSVTLASGPLVTLVIAVLMGQERLTPRAVVSGLLAVAGVVVLSLEAIGGASGGSSYLLAAVAATIAMAASSVIAKAYGDVHPINMNAVGMLAGAALLAAASLVFNEPWMLPRQTQTLAALAWLVVAGSVGLFQLFLYVVQRWTASASVYAVTAMPVVAVILGALLLDQPITARVVVGGAMVLAAVYVGAIAPTRSSALTDRDVSPGDRSVPRARG
jgi:drug/metabolite transporter (DMT)-like permease